MTDDPEITDPRDPHKWRDIVPELDRWLQSRASLREATVSHALLEGAREEIVALRETVERQKLVLSKGHAEVREEALEEAAQLGDRIIRQLLGTDRESDRIAAADIADYVRAIRALKETGDE